MSHLSGGILMEFMHKRVKRFSGLLAVLLLVAACDSPEEKAQNFIENGQKLYKEEAYVKAVIEFKNALQIDKKLMDAWYGLALAEEKRGKWDQVAGALKHTLDINPEHYEANLKLGKLLILGGQAENALEYSNKAIELQPEEAAANALQGIVLFKIKDVDGALKYAEKALKLDPSNTDAILMLAAHSVHSGDGAKGLAYLDRAIDADKDNLGLKLIKIQALATLERSDESEALFIEIMKRDPGNAEIANAFTRFYLSQNEVIKAEKVLRDLAATRKGDVETNSRLVRFLNEAYGSKKAIEELEKLIAANDNNFDYKMVLVNLLSGGGNADEAIEVLNGILSSETDDAKLVSTKLRLAEVFTTKNEWEKSKELFEPILAEDALEGRALLLRAAYRLSKDNQDGAIEDLRTVLRDNPNSIRALFMLGNVHSKKGSYELANDRFNLAFRASEFSPQMGLIYARFLLARKSPQRAEDALLKVIQKGRANLQVLDALANLRLQNGDWTGAQEIVEMMRRAGTDEKKTLKLQGHIYEGQKRFDQSIQSFESAYSKSPLQLQPMVDLVRTYIRSGKIDEAHSFIDSVLVANKDSYFGNLLKARLYAMEDKATEAEESFKKAISIDPKNLSGYRTFASFFIDARDFPQALDTIKAGLDVNNEDIALVLMKANVQEMQKDFDEAIKSYEQILEAQPENLIAKNNLANLLLMRKDDQNAISRAYELAKTFEGTNIPAFKDTLGMAYLEKGETENAKGVFEELTEQYPLVSMFQYHLGLVYNAAGNKIDAKTALEKALEKADQDPFLDKQEIENLLKTIQ
jgi:tetratricopeptide (TPR) repeat protein